MNQKLPPDIIMEILTWTYIESLPRLRWVCKEWRRLISHPHFINRHHQTAKSVCGFVLDKTPLGKYEARKKYEIHFFPHPSPPLSEPLPPLTFMLEPVHIKASTPNGLLFCFGLFNRSYYVCKPTTQEWSAIPSPGPQRYIAKFAMSVASTSPLRFRIMMISRLLKKLHYHCEVFDSDSTGVWKTIDCATPLLDGRSFVGLSVRWGLVMNGSFFWIKQIGDYEYTNIMCVDLWKEEGSTLELPKLEANVNFINRLSNLRGGLGLVSRKNGTVKFDIWAMSGSVVEQKWEKLHVFELENDLRTWVRFGWMISDFILDNHVLINRNENQYEVLWYNFKEKKYVGMNEIIYVRPHRSRHPSNLYFFQSDYFPCNIDECPYNNSI